LPSDSKHDKREFLADVSSFANASGGDIVYGIAEENGSPLGPLEGLDIANPDQEILRLENMIRTGIRPRIPGIHTRAIPLSNANVVIVMRVPKSWASPHRVIYDGHDKFYSRSSNGKYPLDVDELRSAFIASETLTDRIRDFRVNRIAKIIANETPMPLLDNPKIVLHLIPLASFSTAQRFDIDTIASNRNVLRPIYCRELYSKYNLDGLLAYGPLREGKSHSYVQLYRNGIIEAVEALLLAPHEKGLYIYNIEVEQETITSLEEYISVFKSLTVEPPIFIFLNLLRVRGYIMAGQRSRTSYAIDRDNLLLPEIVIESYDDEPAHVLQPCFDAIWNACGRPRSPNYNDEGEWAPRR
jgi:hypothetical protein